MRLYFIGGASGSGKTAVMPHLKELLGDGIAVYDFDDIGVPEGANKKWRQESTEKWLQKLLSDGKDACLLGQIVLGEILSCPSATQIDKINFCLLDVSDFERIKRLKKRNTYGADQNMLNWSAWLRMHHQDPQWVPHVIREDAASNMDFGKLSSLKNYEEVANVKILDTTELALHEVAGQLTDWIRSFNLGPFHVVKVQPHELSVIEDKITSYNNSKVPFIQEQPFINLNFCIKDESGVIIAGITSVMYCWGMLFVDILAVDEKHYKNGLGSKLLSHVENEAKKLGAKLAHLDTFDFQAKDFYLKHGYEIFGVLEDCPQGHERYYMKKALKYKKYDQTDSLKVVVDHNPSQADNDAVREGLVTDYERKMNTTRDKEFSVFLKNDSGEILGGIQTQFDSESVYLETLWVDQKLRNQGYGTKLINAAELEAIKNGCVFSTLDTWDFQAEGFYLKNGYKPMGEIKKYWHGHSRIFLRKVL